jgi:hypothetical protein
MCVRAKGLDPRREVLSTGRLIYKFLILLGLDKFCGEANNTFTAAAAGLCPDPATRCRLLLALRCQSETKPILSEQGVEIAFALATTRI